MTERDPADLYDVLHDRLADYGQAPPAALWAGIRAQLPGAPAGPPWRRRRWAPALLLGLLLAVVGGAGWRWWRPVSNAARATRARLAARPVPTPSFRRKSAPHGFERGVVAKQPATASKLVFHPLPPEATRAGSFAGAAGVTAESGGSPPVTEAIAASRPARTKWNRVRPTGGAAFARASGRGRWARGWGFAAPLPEQARAVTNRPPNPERTEAGRVAGKAAEQGSGTGEALPVAAEAPARLAVPGSPAEAESAFISSCAEGRLLPLVALIITPTITHPVVLAAADTLHRSPPIYPGRWAFEALAGPTLTYRRLGSPPGPDPAPTRFSPAAVQPGLREEPGTGGSVNLQLRRALSGRWSLSTGLGYEQFAVVVAAAAGAGQPAPVRQVGFLPQTQPPIPEASYRDTYRFLTVPVRVGYALGRPAGRLRYGLLAGAEGAVYLGGTVADATGTPRHWGSSGSPYRALSLALSLGFDVRYRLAPRWEALAQPTATYFLTSLTPPAAGYAPRYLLGAGVLAGVSFGLR